MVRRLLLVSCLSTLWACSAESPPVAPSLDASPPTVVDAEVSPEDGGLQTPEVGIDLGIEDAARPEDLGTLFDAGRADAGRSEVIDPSRPGPFAVGRFSDVIRASSANDVPIDCRFGETSPEPRPLVLIAPGFGIGVEQYVRYADRLASHGFLACLVDYPTGLLAHHAENARDLGAVLDALLAPGRVSPGGVPDPVATGLMGHSLGGKLAFLLAADDARVAAVFGLDPVDGSVLCPPSRCPDATDRLPLGVPVAVVGETLDARSSRGQACAPADDNFQTFFEASASPALEVDVFGANHVSFLDDRAQCGLPCRFCNAPRIEDEAAGEVARRFMVAFFRRHLMGELEQQTFLTGAEARNLEAAGTVGLRVK